MKISHGLAPVLALAGTAHAADITAHYTCSDGSTLVATFVASPNVPTSVTLHLSGGKSLALPQAMSADGGRYADGKTEFWIKGKGATFTYGGREIACQNH